MEAKVIRCQKLTQAVFERITHIWHETGIGNPDRADSFAAIQDNLDHGGLLLLAEIGDDVIGTIWLSHDFRRLYIHHMAVLPALQNRGVGKSLLQEALAIAKDLGYQAKLEVHKDNAAARHLYQNLGFEDLEGYITMIIRRV
ncbi:MAG: GNAT family N-acetyltransferase [Candidatus Cloacimonadaceae bacterium]|nr:GNAT family N-acetyltransferase [Candidatus Cloacimonadaceae bacterium]MDP3114508.1 GNAT family N-acetyltransferase [Candidatus Cloacimonadaceae bacterium]